MSTVVLDSGDPRILPMGILSVPNAHVSMQKILDHTHNRTQLLCLCEQVHSLAPVPTSKHGAAPTSVPCNVQQTKFIFICRDVSGFFTGLWVQKQ